MQPFAVSEEGPKETDKLELSENQASKGKVKKRKRKSEEEERRRI